MRTLAWLLLALPVAVVAPPGLELAALAAAAALGVLALVARLTADPIEVRG